LILLDVGEYVLRDVIPLDDGSPLYALVRAQPAHVQPLVTPDQVWALRADRLVDWELLDVWWTLGLDSRRRHPFHDPRSERVEVSA
jgi:hypothetical protein